MLKRIWRGYQKSVVTLSNSLTKDKVLTYIDNEILTKTNKLLVLFIIELLSRKKTEPRCKK